MTAAVPFLPDPLRLALKAGEKAFAAYLEDRKQIAAEELQRAMRNGRPWRIASDRTAAMALQFRRAWEEGAARANLRLIAQAIESEGAEPSLGHSEYRRHVENLAGLTYPEIVLCAGMVTAVGKAPSKSQASSGGEGAEANMRWMTLFNSEVAALADRPPFSGLEDFRGACTSLLRTGWFWEQSVYGRGPIFRPTPSFIAVCAMVDFSDAGAVGPDHGGAAT